jgi:hypothetical protein
LLCSVEHKIFFAPLALHLSNLLTRKSTGKPLEHTRLYGIYIDKKLTKIEKKKKRSFTLARTSPEQSVDASEKAHAYLTGIARFFKRP